MADQPWQGDACSLVDAFRNGEITPPEAVDLSLAAIDRSELNAFSHVAADEARAAAARRRRQPALRRRPHRGEGARHRGRLARHRGLSRLRRPGGHPQLDRGHPPAGGRRRSHGPDHGQRIRRRQLHPHPAPRIDAQPLESRTHARAVHRGARRRRWPAASSLWARPATAAAPSVSRPVSPAPSV